MTTTITPDGREVTDEQLAARKTWADALRSGNYDQAEGVLRAMASEYNFDTGDVVRRDPDSKKKCCCLGVVCDLAPIGKWAEDNPEIFILEGNTVTDAVATAGSTLAARTWDAMPPQEVLDWVGLSESEAAELARLNDGDWTFAEIADLIDGLHRITFDQLCELDSIERGADQLRAFLAA